jgi:ABC-type antimicrobial peptide transport system permease subunit
MSLWNTLRVALKALRRNPSRALLTTLGIVIGIAAVITMMEIGKGSSTSIQKSIEKMGANSVLVLPSWVRTGGVSQGAGTAASLTPADAEAIGRECPSVANFSPIVRANGMQVIFGNNNWVPAQMYGVSPDYMTIRNWELEEGRFFSEREVERNARVCLVGSTLVRELFGGKSPIDCEMRIRNATFKVIGVLKSKGANMMGWDEDDVVLAPWTAIRMRVTGRKSGSATSTTRTAAATPGELFSGSGVAFYPEQDSSLTKDKLLVPRFTYIDQIIFSAVTPDKVGVAVREVTRLLRERHGLKPYQEDDFRIRNSADFMKMLNNTSTMMTNLLLVVALISLIVGGVGIMNIMLVSVTERTREIGLRMAVGARSRDILKQFLIESIVLCLIGGFTGIILGHGAALLVESQLNWPIESSPGAVIAAVVVSAAVGVIFGFYPAWKASKLDPIEALRYE